MHSQDERTMAMIAHASSLLNLLTGFGGIIVALVIYFIQKDKSAWVAFQALQAFVFQLVTAVVVGFLAVIGIILTAFLIGCLILPIALLLGLASVGYSCYAAYRTYQGFDFKYPVIGDWLERQQPPTIPPAPPAPPAA